MAVIGLQEEQDITMTLSLTYDFVLQMSTRKLKKGGTSEY